MSSVLNDLQIASDATYARTSGRPSEFNDTDDRLPFLFTTFWSFMYNQLQYSEKYLWRRRASSWQPVPSSCTSIKEREAWPMSTAPDKNISCISGAVDRIITQSRQDTTNYCSGVVDNGINAVVCFYVSWLRDILQNGEWMTAIHVPWAVTL